MKPAPFAYHRADSLGSALALLAAHPDAKPIAGGQSLVPAMNFRLAQPSALVDLNRLTELRGISALPDGGARIGAMTRHAEVERSALIAERAPLLHEAMPFVAHAQIRSRGTIGGTLAHADPSAEVPAVLLALDATFVLTSASGERRVAANEFFTGLFSTALAHGELITAIEIPPRRARSGSSFMEVARRHGDYALCGVAAELSLGSDGAINHVRLALLSVSDKPLLAQSVQTLVGQQPSAESLGSAADAVREEVDPPSDIHADAGYRRQLAGVLAKRALTEAVRRAKEP